MTPPPRPADDPDPPFAIVLCAGASSRMGRAKATLPLQGRPVIAWHLERLAVACDPLVVVVGADASEVRAAVGAEATVVVNADWASTHPVDSLRVGLDRVPWGTAGFVVPVDTPPAAVDTLQKLIWVGAPAVPVDPAGRSGHPVLVSPDIVARIRSGPVQGGLRTLLGEARRVAVDDPMVAWDFDDPDAFERFVSQWKETPPASDGGNG
ncbi:MAG: NTP transferase domain-containing protein [Myxococcota bacterium]